MNNKEILVAGVDEVGRGPLAGPVVAAAVILKKPIIGLKDSKKLTEKKRQELSELIIEDSYCFAYGKATVDEIDQLNIHHASLLAMSRAVDSLAIKADKALIDGKFGPKLSIPYECIINGDSLIAEISAASIIAKVLRDNEMIEMDRTYPGYGFASHKGYGTKSHMSAIDELGPCDIHRKSFAPINKLIKRSNPIC